MKVKQYSIELASGGRSQKITISSTSAASAAFTRERGGADGPMEVIVTATTDCFVRRGSAPTAVSDGTDHFLPSFIPHRIPIIPGEKLAFITTGAAGLVYCTPEN